MPKRRDDEKAFAAELMSMVGTPCKQCEGLGKLARFEIRAERRNHEMCLGGRSVEFGGDDVFLYCPCCKYRGQIKSSFRDGWQAARDRLWTEVLVESGLSPGEIKRVRKALKKALRTLTKNYSREVSDSLISFLTA